MAGNFFRQFFSAPERLANFYIDVSSNADGTLAQNCAHDTQPYSASETRVYTCPNPLQGRYVRIRFPETTLQYLQLCEVQVQGNKGFHYNISENKYIQYMHMNNSPFYPV